MIDAETIFETMDYEHSYIDEKRIVVPVKYADIKNKTLRAIETNFLKGDITNCIISEIRVDVGEEIDIYENEQSCFLGAYISHGDAQEFLEIPIEVEDKILNPLLIKAVRNIDTTDIMTIRAENRLPSGVSRFAIDWCKNEFRGVWTKDDSWIMCTGQLDSNDCKSYFNFRTIGQ